MADESWRADLHRNLTTSRLRKRASPYSSRAWKARRAELRDGAVCCLCVRFGVQAPAEVADHIIPAADGDFAGELQALCLDCHKIKRVLEGQWRKGVLNARELYLATGKEAMRLRAAAFGTGHDGYPLVQISDSRE
jgi:5-methylcytosine-specific restriction endonuclease McrA